MASNIAVRKLNNCRKFHNCDGVKSIMARDTKGCGDCTARAIMDTCARCVDFEREYASRAGVDNMIDIAGAYSPRKETV